jgi:hypothetical protein
MSMSTTNKRPPPFRVNWKLLARNKRLWRLVRAGLTGHESKTEMRQLGERAMAERTK